MRAIVDAHHHLWDLDAIHYPWLMARGVRRFFGDPTPIQRNYLVRDYRVDAARYRLAGSVHVQVGVAAQDAVAETAWLERTADAHGLPSAIVAFCDLSQPDAAAILERHRAHPRCRGIRQIVGRSDDEDAKTGSAALLTDSNWVRVLAGLGDLALSFDLQLTPRQVPAAVAALAAAPHTPIALCHAGSPWDQSERGRANWRAGLADLAALPHVHCKLSGFGMFDHGWTTESIRPLIEACLEIFGTERCMFGSNFPVDRLHADFDRVWGAYETLTAGLDESVRDALFRTNAAAFYRIELTS